MAQHFKSDVVLRNRAALGLSLVASHVMAPCFIQTGNPPLHPGAPEPIQFCSS